MNREMLTLAFVVAYLLVVFGIRTLIMLRTAGTTGIRGFGRGFGTLEWLGGFGFVVAIAIALASPALQAAGLVVALVSPAPIWLDVVAASAMLAGIAGTLWSQSAMGVSWRIGVDDAERTSLVETGPFHWVRNPVFSFMILSLLGLLAFLPNVATVASTVIAVLSIQLQVRLVEEPYLRRTFGDAYREYEQKAGRFVPGWGRNTAIRRQNAT